VTALRSIIEDFQAWQTQTTAQLAKASHDATRAQAILERTDIVELQDNIHQIKRTTVTQDTFAQLQRTQVASDKTIQENRAKNEKLDSRLTTLEAKDWISQTEYRQAQTGLHMELDTLTTTVTLNELRTQPISHTNLQAIETKHEEVTDALDALYESIKEDLLNETKEYLVTEIDFEIKKDQSVQRQIATITKAVFANNKIETAMKELLDNTLTTAMDTELAKNMHDALDHHMADIKKDIKRKLEQQLTQILEPSLERTRNPYNPVDRAMKSIRDQIQTMVKEAIHEIDTIVKGTVDQAVEDVRLSARHNPRQEEQYGRPATHHATSKENPPSIPSVTPERTFRGRTVHIDEPPPRPDGHARDSRNYDRCQECTRNPYEDYDRSQEAYRRQRDQESFLKGHVEASLESLKEDDMIVWYKSFESYCSLHNIPLLTFHQVTKGTDLYPSSQPASERPRFSRVISLKLNQLHLIKDPTAKSIKNARVGRDDGYGALYALLAATIP
jgi:hypothetical protein